MKNTFSFHVTQCGSALTGYIYHFRILLVLHGTSPHWIDGKRSNFPRRRVVVIFAFGLPHIRLSPHNTTQSNPLKHFHNPTKKNIHTTDSNTFECLPKAGFFSIFSLVGWTSNSEEQTLLGIFPKLTVFSPLRCRSPTRSNFPHLICWTTSQRLIH